MIVVDTNVIAYLWLPGTFTAQAEKLLRQDPDWNAPLVWRSEFRNILAGYLRRKHVDVPDALRLCASAEEQLRGHEYEVPSSAILERVAQSPCSAYDCEFVAIAVELGTALVTTDQQVLGAFPDLARALGDYVADG